MSYGDPQEWVGVAASVIFEFTPTNYRNVFMARGIANSYDEIYHRTVGLYCADMCYVRGPNPRITQQIQAVGFVAGNKRNAETITIAAGIHLMRRQSRITRTYLSRKRKYDD